MRSFLAFFLLCALSASASAGDVDLFSLKKPKNPENLVQTFVPVGPGCQLGDLDFRWLMNGTTPKTPNSILRCNILKRLMPLPEEPNNRASCQKAVPGKPCSEKFIMPEEIKLMSQSAPLVIRAEKQPNGTCKVGAYIDAGSKVVKVKRINANGKMISESIAGGTVLFTDAEIIADDDTRAADWKCTHNCMQSVTGSLFCH